MPAAAARSAAIETESFGLDLAEAAPDGRLHIAVAAGRTSTGRLRLYNKTDAPITVQLTVSPATVDARGNAELGGDPTAVSWVDVETEPVELGPRQQQVVEVRVRAPRRIDDDRRAVAIVAEPAQLAGQPPAVLQRVAITTFLEPDRKSLVASLGWYPWLALVLLVVAAALAARRARSRR